MKKYILKLYIYTDGDWGIDNTFTDKCMKNYVSKYFDNDLYEYTELPDDNYTYRLVRVFDTADELIDFVDSIKCSLHGNKYYIDEYIPEFFDRNIEEFLSRGYTNDFMDSNTEIELYMSSIETDAKKVKEIIYED